MSMTVNDILAILTLVERGAMSLDMIMGMREAGVTDEQILSSIEKMKQRQERLKSLDLRNQ